METDKRIIIHVDMDAFFAAIEVRDNPSLAGKPLIIGALPHERGVVSTCSYEARRFGVHSAMSIKEAYRLCPNGIYMHPNFEKYQAASARIREILSSYSDLVEFVALDEGYLDVTGSEHLFGGAEKIGREIKARIKADIGITCSVGIGYCMMAAKLASEEKKPDGFFILPNPQALQALIIDRPIGILYGVGRSSRERYEKIGIRTVRDLLNASPYVLKHAGIDATEAIAHARGIDLRQVTPEAEPKSIGNEHTFQHDITELSVLEDMLVLTARKVGLRLKFKNLYCRTVTLKIKFANMKSITRAYSGKATNDPKEICHSALALLHKADIKAPVRLIGISTSHFTTEKEEQFEQLTFENYRQEPKKKEESKLDAALMNIYRTYGKGALKTGKEIAAEQHLFALGDSADDGKDAEASSSEKDDI